MSANVIRIYDKLDLPPGNLAVSAIHMEAWGSIVRVDCVYRYPPVEKPFTLIFQDCRGIEWNVQKTVEQMATHKDAQFLTHNLGQPNYQHTAHFATTLVELTLSYRVLTIEKEWD